MASEARSEVLGRIRRALQDRPHPAPIPRDYRAADAPQSRATAELIDLLADRLDDYRARVRRCGTDDVGVTIAAALAEREAKHIVVPHDIDPQWTDALAVEISPDDPPLTPADLDGLDGVLTTCAVAIAETGTIVLDGGAGQGRRVITLVPDYHLVVVPSDRVVGTVPAAIAQLDPGRVLTWISGPSATSDIELDRVEGVHGPRTLEVILAG